MTAFDLLGIPLVHGWLVDPADAATAAAFGTKSYNELIEMLVSTMDAESVSRLASTSLRIASSLDTTRSMGCGAPLPSATSAALLLPSTGTNIPSSTAEPHSVGPTAHRVPGDGSVSEGGHADQAAAFTPDLLHAPPGDQQEAPTVQQGPVSHPTFNTQQDDAVVNAQALDSPSHVPASACEAASAAAAAAAVNPSDVPFQDPSAQPPSSEPASIAVAGPTAASHQRMQDCVLVRDFLEVCDSGHVVHDKVHVYRKAQRWTGSE